MPDRTDLDERLAGGRAALLAEIAQPPLERVTARAAAIRRRRRRVRGAGAALVAVAAVAFLVRPDSQPPPEVAQPPRPEPVYAAEGITINGLPDPAAALDLPGTVTDVEFTDPEHGYAVTACFGAGAGCRPAFAATSDGGRSWTERPMPAGVPRDAHTELVVFVDGSLTLRAGDRTYSVRDGDAGEDEPRWHPASAGNATLSAVRAGEVLRLRPGGPGCAGGVVEVWTPGFAPRGALHRQPDLDVCWVSAVPSATGAWWVGGVSGGRAAVAVSRDGGATWRREVFSVDGTARVALLGGHVYAVASGVDGALRAVFHSADRGESFRRVDTGALPKAMAGDPVPLLDGRLLLVEPTGEWQVSKDDGATFRAAVGTLPAVGRLARTPAGYVAYDLFNAGWTAFSADGTTWRKLDLR
jgi:photosystem II stability/assembly factor-like uncharacterized protein